MIFPQLYEELVKAVGNCRHDWVVIAQMGSLLAWERPTAVADGKVLDHRMVK